MPNDHDALDQLATYFEWLEGHLDTKLSAATVPIVTRHRLPLARVLGLAAVVVLVAAAGAVAVRPHSRAVLHPQPSHNNPARPAPTSAAVPDHSTVAPSTTSYGGHSEPLFAPVDLPQQYEVTRVGFGQWADSPERRAYYQYYESADSVSSLTVVDDLESTDLTTSDEVANASIHGNQARVFDAEGYDAGVAWREAGHVFHAFAVGFDTQLALRLLNSARVRGTTQGLDPTTIGGDLTLVKEGPTGEPGPYTVFVVRDVTSGSTVRLLVGDNSPPLELTATTSFSLQRTVPVVRVMWDQPDNETMALNVLGHLAALDRLGLEHVADEARSRGQSEGEVGRVEIGATQLVLRGGTADHPRWACVRDSSGERCDAIVADPLGGQGPLFEQSIRTDAGWYIVGARATVAQSTTRFCEASSDGTVRDELSIEWSDSAGGNRYFAVRVPSDVEFVAWCDRRDGTLVRLNDGMYRRWPS